jgi:hypothetical protein
MVGHSCVWGRKVPKDSDSISNSAQAGDYSSSFSDVLFQNERAMWWQEFDSVGEKTVRDYVERNSYTPTGMVVARQWLARHDILQLRGDVQSIRALAEQAQGTASQLASRVDANGRAIAEIAATAKRNARTMVFAGVVASVFALCAIVMVLASSRQGTPNIKQVSGQSSRPQQTIVRPLPTAVPPAETQQASAIPPENTRQMQQSNALQSADMKPGGQSLRESLALIADKVAGEGTINFTAQFRNMATGWDQYDQRLYKVSSVTTEPDRCQLRYHWHVEQGGRPVFDLDRTVDLRLAKRISLTSIAGESGRRVFVRAYPKVYVVHIARGDNSSGHNFYFYNQDMAARVVAGARRAVELCDKRKPGFRGR